MSYQYPKPSLRPKKQPSPLKRTPLKKGKITILKHFTLERAKLEKAKHDTYRSLDRPPFCQGCGRSDVPLSHSHRLSQGNRQHIANPRNLDLYCMGENGCHENWERGTIWVLDNGAEAMEFLKETDFEKYRSKAFKMSDRLRESGVKPENLPDWAQEILNEIS